MVSRKWWFLISFLFNMFQASELQTSMIETMEAVEIEKQRHHSTRMEALARLARLEVYPCLQMSPTQRSQVLAMLLKKIFAGYKRWACKVTCQGTMESGSSSMFSFSSLFVYCVFRLKVRNNGESTDCPALSQQQM